MFRRKTRVSSERIDFAMGPDRTGKAPSRKPRAVRDDTYVECAVSTGPGHLERGIVVDVSETGARIRFYSRWTLPGRVRISAPRLGLDREAEVVWQDFNEAGLKFL